MGHEIGEKFPDSLGFLLDNPIRRFLEKPADRIRKLGLVNGAVLEVGCGPGFFNLPLAENNRLVVAFDVSAKFLKRAHRKVVESDAMNIFFMRCEASKIPLKDGSFDYMFVHFVYHELDNRDDFIEEAWRVLKNEGKVVMVDVEPTRGWGRLFGPPGAASDEAAVKFKARFKRIEVQNNGGRRYILRALKS